LDREKHSEPIIEKTMVHITSAFEILINICLFGPVRLNVRIGYLLPAMKTVFTAFLKYFSWVIFAMITYR
jgi:hypothetical protein